MLNFYKSHALIIRTGHCHDGRWRRLISLCLKQVCLRFRHTQHGGAQSSDFGCYERVWQAK